MNDHTNELSEAFVAHEHLAPDAADVLAKSHSIARSYQRRRWAVRATGGAVLAGGLVAGGIALPGRASGHGPAHRPAGLQFADGGSPSSSPSTSPSSAPATSPSSAPSTSPGTTATATYSQQAELDAFFNAGYVYADAQSLADTWNLSDIVSVKAKAGLDLLQGVALPVPPSGTPATQTEIDQDAFFNAGYDYDDAVTLAADWNETNIDQVKAEAGAKLIAGDALPVQPSGGSGVTATGGNDSSPAEAKADDERAKFFAEGYTYEDAVALARYFNNSDPWQVKAEAGKVLLDGGTLPTGP